MTFYDKVSILFRRRGLSVEIVTIGHIDNHGIIGNTHAPVTINHSEDKAVGEIEKELLSISLKLDLKKKMLLLERAYELEENSKN